MGSRAVAALPLKRRIWLPTEARNMDGSHPHAATLSPIPAPEISITTDPPLNGFDPWVDGDGGDDTYTWQVALTALTGGARLLRWCVRRRDGGPFRVLRCRAAVAMAAIDLHRVFVPVLHEAIGKRDLLSLPWSVDERSFATWSFPLLAALNRDNVNRLCLAFLDTVHTADATFSCYDREARLALARPVPRTTTVWADGLYLSAAARPVFDEVRTFVRAHDDAHGIVLQGAPAAAWDPVWCSWYGIGHGVDADTIAGMAPLLADTGVGTVIIDDGWFVRDHFDEVTGHYAADLGKFPDLPGLVAELHALGLQVLLWCAPLFRVGEIAHVPFVSKHCFQPEGGAATQFLCPRCPAVRAYAVRTVEHVMRTCGVDGLKIDFIDSLMAQAAQPCRGDHEHDIEDVGAAFTSLLADLRRAVEDVRADALIEFRMNYATPATRSFATSHRAQDAPFDADHIRRMCTRLRSWILRPERGPQGNVAPHTDPACWHPEESEVNVARFLASLVTSAVPMLSMDLRALPPRHLQLMAAWLGFYRQHRDLLLFGDHEVLGADAHHSLFRVHRDGVALWGVFTPEPPAILEAPRQTKQMWVLNGSRRTRLRCAVTGVCTGAWLAVVRDAGLAEVGRERLEALPDELTFDLTVPVAGALELVSDEVDARADRGEVSDSQRPSRGEPR
jgi:hypothetical protein